MRPIDLALLTPVIDHFETAWVHLRQLALVAEEFCTPPDHRPLPIQHFADFIVDDVLDVYRGSASEVVLLVPTVNGWMGNPSPEDVLDEGERFQRLLTVARMAAASGDVGDLLTVTALRVTAELDGWADTLAPLLSPIHEALEAAEMEPAVISVRQGSGYVN